MEVICETGPPAYRPYPRRLESLTICGCNYKGSTPSPQLFKDPECWSGQSQTHDLPHGSPMPPQGGGGEGALQEFLGGDVPLGPWNP